MSKAIIILCILIFVNYFSIADSVTTTRKPIPNKNSTSNVVTVAALGPITTTQRPLFQGVRLPCSCLQGQCGCCTGVILERFKQKACVNITYEADDFAFTAAMNLNGRVLFKNTISGKNPPPICVRIPRIQIVELCVEFSNLFFANRNMHVCVGMEATFQGITLFDLSFNCVRMGINGIAVVGPEEGGGFPITPIDEEEQIDEDYDDSARDSQLSHNHHIRKPVKSNYSNFQNITDFNKIPVAVKRLASGNFLVIFKENVKNNSVVIEN